MIPLPELFQAASLFTIPLLVAAAGELIVERAGVVNISIEGMMLVGALAAWIANGLAGPAFGVVAAMLAAIVLAMLFALAAIVMGADQIVTGTGVNLLAFGAAALVYKRMDPLISTKAITAIAPAWMGFAGVVLIAGAWIFLARTRWGLELRAIGESPQAADAAGIRVNRRKTLALVFGAACAGLAGSYLSTMRVQGFTEHMTQGDGFLALAIVIFGRWHPAGILAAGMFFGIVRAVALSMQTHTTFGPDTAQLFRLLPYVVSLLALAGVAGKSRAPAALGKAW